MHQRSSQIAVSLHNLQQNKINPRHPLPCARKPHGRKQPDNLNFAEIKKFPLSHLRLIRK